MRPWARRASAVAWATALLVFAWLFRFNDPDGGDALLTDDHFFYVVRGWQILFGDLPVRDFVDHGAPLYYYVAAAVQHLFGRGALSEIAFSVTVLALCAVGVLALATRASGSIVLGGAAATLYVLLAPRFYNYPKILVYVLAIPAIWRVADRPNAWSTAAVALVAVAGFLFRHDHGVFVAAAFAVLLVSAPLSWAVRRRQATVFALVTLGLLAPYLAFIQFNGGLATYFTTAAEWAQQDRGRAPVVWPGLFDNPDGVSIAAGDGFFVRRWAAVVQDNAVAWLYYTELALPLVALALVGLSASAFRPGWPHARAKVTSVAVLGVLLNAGFLRSPLAARLADPSVPHLVLAAWMAVVATQLVRGRDHLTWPRSGHGLTMVRGAAVATIAALLVVLVCAGTENLPRRLEKAYMTTSVTTAFDRSDDVWTRLARAFPIPDNPSADPDDLITLSLYVRRCTSPTDRIFVQDYLPQVVALAERGFAGGHADLRPGFFTSDEMQRLTVARLQAQPVPMALLSADDAPGGFRDAFPLVMAYLDEHFETAGERRFGGRFPIRLLVNRNARVFGRYEPLGWPCLRQ